MAGLAACHPCQHINQLLLINMVPDEFESRRKLDNSGQRGGEVNRPSSHETDRSDSPVAGRVGDLTARIGQFVQPGMRMMTVVPVHDLYLEANYKETQISLMRVGQPATIEVDALPNEKLHGEVLSFSPGTGSEFSLLPPQNATGNFTKVVQRVPVRIRIDAGPEARKVLVPGLSIVVDVDTRTAKADINRQRGELQDSRKAAQ